MGQSIGVWGPRSRHTDATDAPERTHPPGIWGLVLPFPIVSESKQHPTIHRKTLLILVFSLIIRQFFIEQVETNQHPLAIGQIANNFPHWRGQNFCEGWGG